MPHLIGGGNGTQERLEQRLTKEGPQHEVVGPHGLSGKPPAVLQQSRSWRSRKCVVIYVRSPTHPVRYAQRPATSLQDSQLCNVQAHKHAFCCRDPGAPVESVPTVGKMAPLHFVHELASFQVSTLCPQMSSVPMVLKTHSARRL